MFNRWFHPRAHDFLHPMGFAIVAVGLPLNKVLMSIGTIWVVANILLDGDFRTYRQRIFQNRSYWWVLSLYLLGVIGLLWTEDYSYGLNDLRKKLPLLALPLAMVAKPLDKRGILLCFALFSIVVLGVSIYNFTQFFGTNTTDAQDIRGMSRFGSHIRFGLMVVTSMLALVELYRRKYLSAWIVIPILLWLIYYTYVSQVLSAYLAFTGILLALLHLGLHRFLNKWSNLLLLTPFVLFMFALYFVQHYQQKALHLPDKNELPTHSSSGRPYHHHLDRHEKENGHFIFTHIQNEELQMQWQKRSEIEIHENDQKGQPIKETILRYLAHRGLSKDSAGISALSPTDIVNIEKGYPTPLHARRGAVARWADLQFQIVNHTNPNGHSLLQRLEYWKTGMSIIAQQPLLGVGTGDVDRAYQAQYDQDQSPLTERYRLRSHNTYITQWVSYGIFGFLVLLVALYSVIQPPSNPSLLALGIVWVFLLSFFVEDTLETQSGVTLFSFWWACLLVWNQPLSEASSSRLSVKKEERSDTN